MFFQYATKFAPLGCRRVALCIGAICKQVIRIMHTIVVFDDSPNHLRLFETVLGRRGYHVITHEGDFRCSEQLDGVVPSLIILGYVRGFFRDEIAALQALRDNPAFASVPILIATTSVRRDSETMMPWQAEAVFIIHKPFDARELVAAVSQALSTKPATRQGQS